jgi:2-hydroxy-3-keto-5-methylthiopentenyl-1-phosphate phosphatase
MTPPNTDPAELPALAVLCDFDGTATSVDVINEIYYIFGDCHCHDLNHMWDNLQITSIQEYLGCFRGIHVPQERIEKTLFDGVGIDPGFRLLKSFCQQRGYPFALISDGLGWYIHYILHRHGIHDLDVFCNEISFTPSGYKFRFPYYDPSTPKRGVCKPNIVQGYRQLAKQVIYIGDGLTDVEGAQAADMVFAKARLYQYFRENNLPVTGFDRIGEIVACLEKMGDS